MKRNMVISLVGRPNVGKSSLFNRLMKRQNKALTHDLPGVTRDRHYGVATFNDFHPDSPNDVILVDTGGFLIQVSLTDNHVSTLKAKNITNFTIDGNCLKICRCK